MSTIVDRIVDMYHKHGDTEYLGEPVSLTDHMLQTALAAERGGGSNTLIPAALLHDYGHLIHDLDSDCAEHGIDGMHESTGARYLKKYYPPSVTEPIRLHVASKRYLCAVDRDYLGALSPASRQSLHLQGGPFSLTEAGEFERHPSAADAILLRRYDDVAKSPGLKTPDLDHYRIFLEGALRTPYRDS